MIGYCETNELLATVYDLDPLDTLHNLIDKGSLFPHNSSLLDPFSLKSFKNVFVTCQIFSEFIFSIEEPTYLESFVVLFFFFFLHR